MVFTYFRIGLIGMLLGIALIISACSGEPKEKKSGQALVSVNGSEVTVLQLNDELRRANVRADQYESASKQLIESLVARQLIVDEAVRNKLDRSPEVVQARERANAQIIAQTYIQGILSKIQKPTKMEIDEYFQQHPQFFQQRKQFDLMSVRLATKDISDEVKKVIDNAKSLNEIIGWLDKQKIPYARNLISRTTADLPSEMVKMLQGKEKETIFIVNEQGSSLLIAVNAIINSPVSIEVAIPQIERFLLSKKQKEAIDAEVVRLRTAAKIEYLNAVAPIENKVEELSSTQKIDVGSESSSNLGLTDLISKEAMERGIMGLK